MSVISLFSASHCHGPEVARGVRDALGYDLLSNAKLLEETSQRFQVPAERLQRDMQGAVSVFNRLTHEKERNLAYIRATLVGLIQPDNLVYHGFAGHLLPRELPHVLRVCLVARMEYRTVVAARSEGIPDKAAQKRLSNEDEERKRWTLHLSGLGPWDKGLYDILVPMDSTTVDEAVGLICEQAG